MSGKSQAEVLETVAGFLREIIDEAWAEDIDITMETSFSDELELESIEFVSLAEKLQGHYGDEVDFVAWLSQKNIDEIIGLKVGDLVDFIVAS